MIREVTNKNVLNNNSNSDMIKRRTKFSSNFEINSDNDTRKKNTGI